MFLSSLYEQLEDKSKILLNKKVLSFEHGKNKVRVKCQDGSEFVGDLVVGVDGVHSRTRQEMQRIAEEEAPGLMKKDLNSKFFLFMKSLERFNSAFSDFARRIGEHVGIWVFKGVELTRSFSRRKGRIKSSIMEMTK